MWSITQCRLHVACQVVVPGKTYVLLQQTKSAPNLDERLDVHPDAGAFIGKLRNWGCTYLRELMLALLQERLLAGHISIDET